MLSIRLVCAPASSDTLVVPIHATRPGEHGLATSGAGDVPADLLVPADLPPDVRAEAVAMLRAGHRDPAGPAAVQVLPRPLRAPSLVLLVGVGAGEEAGWRAAGAAVARHLDATTATSTATATATSTAAGATVAVALPPAADPAAVRGFAEGLWLASYRFRMPDRRTGDPHRPQVLLAVDKPAAFEAALTAARVTAEMTCLARDLTNTPASLKTPAWLAGQMVAAATDRPHLSVTVREPDELAREGFGGLLAVGGGSVAGPRLVELDWHPPDATRHVALVGKGVTFDTGGISIKPRDGMKLMRKDMAGAAAVAAATVGAAELALPVRITTVAALAENMVSGSAFRPGDLIRHYDGTTSESTNADAEGRLILADALGYVVRRVRPDLLVDLATLTGANAIALGKRTAALYSDNPDLAGQLAAAARLAGEQVWRMPLPADYLEYLGSDLADRHSSPDRGAGSVVAALYLREFTGELRGHWAHLDMSAPSWADGPDGELIRGATGWGVRTLLRWLTALSD